MDSVAALTSISLQYGVPLNALVRKFSHQRFEPSGFTKNPQIGRASSIIDYVFRWIGSQFIPDFIEKTRGTGGGQQELNIPGLQEQEAKWGKINIMASILVVLFAGLMNVAPRVARDIPNSDNSSRSTLMAPETTTVDINSTDEG